MRRWLSLLLSTLGNVVFVRVLVGRQSPTSPRNLEKSEHSLHPDPYIHLHTSPVTSHSRSIPTRWASVGRPEGEPRPPLPFSGPCWRRRGPLSAPRRQPPRLPLPSPAGVGPVPEERQRPPQRPQEGAAAAVGAAGDAPARLLRRRRRGGGAIRGGGGAGGGRRLCWLQQRGRELAAAAVVKGIGDGGDGSADVSVCGLGTLVLPSPRRAARRRAGTGGQGRRRDAVYAVQNWGCRPPPRTVR